MKRLIALPFAKSVEIAYKSIRVRLLRSILTTLSLVLAVAFLSYSLVSLNLAQGLVEKGDIQTIQMLNSKGYDISLSGQGMSASPKQKWVVLLSLLVCVVGIINAQLMSVTERFREIGTMKCLGALDRFIVRIFIIEAAMQGLAGSLAGALCGTLIAVTAGLIKLSMLTLTGLPYQLILKSFAISILIGTILSLIGVMYPALMAARMQPVEAMRVDQ